MVIFLILAGVIPYFFVRTKDGQSWKFWTDCGETRLVRIFYALFRTQKKFVGIYCLHEKKKRSMPYLCEFRAYIIFMMESKITIHLKPKTPYKALGFFISKLSKRNSNDEESIQTARTATADRQP